MSMEDAFDAAWDQRLREPEKTTVSRKPGRPVGSKSSSTKPHQGSFLAVCSMLKVGQSIVFPCPKEKMDQIMRQVTTESRYASVMQDYRFTTKACAVVREYESTAGVMVTRTA